MLLRRKDKRSITWVLYAISIIAFYPILAHILEVRISSHIRLVQIPFEEPLRVYFSWILLIASGLALFRLRSNFYIKLSGLLISLIGLYWILQLMIYI